MRLLDWDTGDSRDMGTIGTWGVEFAGEMEMLVGWLGHGTAGTWKTFLMLQWSGSWQEKDGRVEVECWDTEGAPEVKRRWTIKEEH